MKPCFVKLCLFSVALSLLMLPATFVTGPVEASGPRSPRSAPPPQLPIFYGNLHAHTKYSDGSGTPSDAFRRARDVGGLDFLAITEHNHDKAEMGIGSSDPRRDGIMIAVDHSLYNGSQAVSLVSAARSFTADDGFVAIYGQEFSTISSGNHINVFDVQNVIDVSNGDFATLYDEWLQQNLDTLGEAALVQLNHPDYRADIEHAGTAASQRNNDYGLDDYAGDFDELVRHSSRYVSLIEIVSGPALKSGTDLAVSSGNRHEKDYWFYLNKGFHVAPTANQDNHFVTWGTITRARTAVLAERLTKQNILRALKARRVYATEDETLQIHFQLNGANLGSIVPMNQAQDLTIDVDITDLDEPGAEYTVELFRDEIGGPMIEEPIEEASLEGNGRVTFGGQRYESGRVFYFVKVSQVGSGGSENFAWTAPIWIEPAAGVSTPPAGPSGGTATAPRFVHSRHSDVYHFANCSDAARIKPENRITSDTPPEDKRLHRGCPRL
jgi:hypothetical protein